MNTDEVDAYIYGVYTTLLNDLGTKSNIIVMPRYASSSSSSSSLTSCLPTPL